MKELEMFRMNRESNAFNRYQGDAKRVLCVCSAGLLRSPTAAHILFKEYGYNTRSVGCSQEYALFPVDNVHLMWANEIICMEQWQADTINEMIAKIKENDYYRSDEFAPVYSLDIPDKFAYMDPELVELILKEYKDKVGFSDTKENNYIENEITSEC